jgi:hypothetical protein
MVDAFEWTETAALYQADGLPSESTFLNQFKACRVRT